MECYSQFILYAPKTLRGVGTTCKIGDLSTGSICKKHFYSESTKVEAITVRVLGTAFTTKEL